jgi:membrane peptidoglycan carboxypeptidase
MPAQKSTASGLLTAGLGILGFSALAGLLAAVMVAPAVAVGGITANNTVGIFDSLPDYIEVGQQYEANQIVAKNADGSDFHIATLFDQNRQSVPLDQMSDNLKYAAIAGEDRRFYQHGGVDIPSVARAALGQLAKTSSSGASTITMQLVRNIRVQEATNETGPGITPAKRRADVQAAVEPDLGRKVQEMKLAIGLEKKYSKQQILDGYLNIVGMGGNTYGVEAAAEQYFSTTAANLTIDQAASLIAIVQNPTSNGLNNPKNYANNEKRRNFILQMMKTEGYITAAEYDASVKVPVDANYLKISPPKQGCLYATPGYQFICDLVDRTIRRGEVASLGANADQAQQNWKQGGYKVYVSVQPAMQDAGNAAVKQYAPATEQRFALGAAEATVQVGTGRILMEAQNKDFSNLPTDPSLSDYDQARTQTTTSLNLAEDQVHGGGTGYQPGSSFKPYTLLAFLAAGHGLNETFNASLTQFTPSKFVASCDPNGGPSFKVTNDEANEVGPMTVTQGTARSVNTVFMQMGMKVDQCDTRAIAESLGVHNAGDVPGSNSLKVLPSCVIGACQTIAPITQAAAYAAIANNGIFCNPTIVDSIIDAQGNTLAGQQADCAQSPLVTPDVAHTAAYAMQQVFVGNGTAIAANPKDGTPYLGKTGTTDFSHQTWTVGSSTKASTALWVGNIIGPPNDPNGTKVQQLRRISVGGIQAATLRNYIFKATARAIDAQPGFAGGAFPPPAQTLLDGQKTTVPSGLVGGSVAAAQKALDVANLTYQDGGPVDSDLPAGTVASIDPGEGSQVVQGAFVTVYTSNGLAKPVPDVTHQSKGQATNTLHAAGFDNVNTACTQSSGPTDPDNGNVVQQNPAGGTAANPANAVTITVKQTNCP